MADEALARLSAFAGAVGKPVPIAYLEDDMGRRLMQRNGFEMTRFEVVEGVDRIDLTWTGRAAEDELHEGVLHLLAWAGHRGMFIDKERDERSIEYYVVAKTPKGPRGADWHALRISVTGLGVDAILGG